LIDPDDSVLVLVDVQAGFVDRVEPDRADGLLDRIAFLACSARFCGIPVIATVETPEDWGELHPVVRRAAGAAPVIRKEVFGLADDPAVWPAVRETRRSTVVLAGLETDVCVAQSALGLLDRGLRVVIVEDAVASPGSTPTGSCCRWAPPSSTPTSRSAPTPSSPSACPWKPPSPWACSSRRRSPTGSRRTSPRSRAAPACAPRPTWPWSATCWNRCTA